MSIVLRRGSGWAGLLIGWSVLVAAYAGWALLTPWAPERGAAAIAALLCSQGVAALAALRRSRARDEDQDSRVWRILATGWLLWAIGSAVEWGTWVLRGSLPGVPSAADLLHLAGSISFVAAMASYPVHPPERFGRIRNVLDVSILILAVLTLTWLALLRPVLRGLMAPPILLLWAGIRPAMDATLLALVLRVLLLAARRSEARPLWWLGAAGVVLLAGDILFGYQIVLGEHAPGTVLDATSMVGALLAGWAGLAVPAGIQTRSTRPKGSGQRRAEALLPIAFTYAVVGFTVLDAYLSGDIDRAGLMVSVALSVLLVARQGVVIGQSEMLKYASLVNASADLAFICDGSGRLRLFNPSFASALRVTGEPSLAVNLKPFLGARDPVDVILAQGAKEGWSGEVFLRRRDGTSFPALLTLRPVENLRGSEALLAGTAVDVTEIRAREDALRKALEDVAAARSELESLNVDLERKVETRTAELARTVEHLDRLNRELKELDKLKSEFVTLVSHELRAPLTNIRSGLELMLAAHPSLDLSVRESMALVEEEAARLGRFVEAILDLSALEAGRFPLRSLTVSLPQAARLAVERFRGHPAYGRMQVDVPDDLPDVLADERALGSVFFHLLDNAAKYGGGGPIIVRADSTPEVVRVHVDDSGPGIPAGERERVFDPFHRLDTRDARETYGHGLGLHLVKRMLEAMAGGIRVESSPSGGARIAFWVPRAQPSSADVAVAEGSAGGSSRR